MMPYDKYDNDGPVHHRAYLYEPWYKLIIDFALDKIEGKTVFDIGCGDGLFLKLASEKGYSVTGLDNSERGLYFAKSLCPEAKVVRSDITAYEKGEDWTLHDTITCINTIEHLDKPEKVMEIFEAQGVKKLIIITDIPRSEKKKGRYHFREYQPEELIELLGIDKYKHKVTWGLDRFWAVEVWK